MAQAPPVTSPPKPVLEIRPPKGWIGLDLNELWDFRELLFFFSWRDIKVRYKQSLLGVAWAVLGPLAHTVVFVVIFGAIAKMPTDGLPKWLFYMPGLIIWEYFAGSLTNASNSLVRQAHILKKTYFPRLLIPLSGCLTPVVDLLIACVLLVGLMFVFGFTPAPSAFLIPLLLIMAMASALGMGLVFAALNVRYRDIHYALPLVTQLWKYCSVVVPFSEIPAEWGPWRFAFALNPMVGVVEGFRWCVSHPYMSMEQADAPMQTEAAFQAISEAVAPLELIAIGLPVTLLIFVFGLYYFKRMEKYFADIV